VGEATVAARLPVARERRARGSDRGLSGGANRGVAWPRPTHRGARRGRPRPGGPLPVRSVPPFRVVRPLRGGAHQRADTGPAVT